MDQRTLISSIPFDELLGELKQVIKQAEESRLPHAEPTAAEELLTRQQTAKLLGITLPTLRKYTRDELLPGYRIGTRVRYKRSEVIGALQAMEVRKARKVK